MNVKLRTIEIDAETATTLKQRAAARGLSVSDFLAEIIEADVSLDALERLRKGGQGPWAPEILSEDAQRLADFERTGDGVPWAEVLTWMRSWGTPKELPPPRSRKL